jgi:hypothetical protein
MAPHEEFVELCAAATAGELTPDEQAKLAAHLKVCTACRRMMMEYEVVAQYGADALVSQFAPKQEESDRTWSVEEAEKAFLNHLKDENHSPRVAAENHGEAAKCGQGFRYRPSQVRWREAGMSLAAVVFFALALVIAAYRIGEKRGMDGARATADPPNAWNSLEGRVSDLGRDRVQLLAKLAEEDGTISDQHRQLSAQQALIVAMKAKAAAIRRPPSEVEIVHPSKEIALQRDQELATAQAKLLEWQEALKTLNLQRNEATSRAALWETRVGELTQLVRDREREIEEKQDQVAKDQDLLEHDRDIRELIGARDLYIAEIHDVSGDAESNKTYGRIFYTRGRRLVFYAYDLDEQHGVQEASTFQAWGRRGPNKRQALNLGVFYEDNASKKRWVLRADNPKSFEDIDAVFVTIEPNGGSQHPSGKQLLFAYLRIRPNHP